ncbi:MAG: exo-alpha-sialidase [Abitibacteriaceae bacterium]|nr:exo-alpha-sialidase [Abditibacteriaceae bacterium]
MNDTLLLLVMAASLVPVLSLAAVPTSPAPSTPPVATNLAPPVAVFTPGDAGYPAVRIPSIVVTKAGTLLAFAEGRRNLSDQAENKIIQKLSTDGGKTWSKLQTIAADGRRPLNNPCTVVDQKTGQVLLMFQSYPEHLKEKDSRIQTGYAGDDAGDDIVKSYLIRSNDDGATWSQIEDVTRQVKHPTGATTIASGPGIGIQLQKGPHAGRLLMPFNEGPYGQWNIYTAYSDDDGATWQYGDNVPGGMGLVNECQVVELSDGRARINSRRGGGHDLRKTSVSQDGGQTWSPVEDVADLVDPTCMASIIRFNAPAGTQLLFAGPLGPGRTNGTIHVSSDDGQTWPVQKTLFPGPYAYSILVALPDDTVGDLYEAAEHKIVFARFPLEAVLK